MRRKLLASSLTLGATTWAGAQQPKPEMVPVRELTPVVTSIVITAPYGQPPEIRITVASPYAGAKIIAESKVHGEPSKGPQPMPMPLPVPEKPERRPFATIGPPPPDSNLIVVPAPARPPVTVQAQPKLEPPSPSPAARAAKIEAPYRRNPGR